MKNRQQLLGILAIAALIILAGDRIIRGPLMQSWKARAERVAHLQALVARGTSLLERETIDRPQWDGMRTNTLAQEVSTAESELLRAFDNWSRKSGVSISGIRPQWKRGADDFATLECRADASGDLASLTRFLYELERDRLGVKVDGLELSTRDNQAQQLTLGLQVSGLQLNLTR